MQQSHTYRIRTSQRTDLKCGKSVPAQPQEEFQNIFSLPSKEIKTPYTQTKTTKAVKPNKDNGLQRWTDRRPTANIA